jgi:L-amino acid N-acyltransferase YncA
MSGRRQAERGSRARADILAPANLSVRVGPLRPSDWGDVRRIFLEGIATGNATFETEAPDWETWDRAHRPDCRLIARDEGVVASAKTPFSVVGWAALTRVSQRRAYDGVAEVSVYVAANARGRGVGGALLGELVRASEAAGVWTLQAGIFPENAASIAVHEACGFRRVGMRERIGRLAGAWRDVVLMERRSPVVGS